MGRSFKVRIFVPKGNARTLYALQPERYGMIITCWDLERRKRQEAQPSVRQLAMDPNKILSEEAVAMPHRTVIDLKRRQTEILNQALLGS
jgi:hypothetical protein